MMKNVRTQCHLHFREDVYHKEIGLNCPPYKGTFIEDETGSQYEVTAFTVSVSGNWKVQLATTGAVNNLRGWTKLRQSMSA